MSNRLKNKKTHNQNSQKIHEKSDLTERQKEIATRLIDGRSAKEISKEFGISLHTVEGYQKLIKKKLVCKNAYQTGYKLWMALKDKGD